MARRHGVSVGLSNALDLVGYLAAFQRVPGAAANGSFFRSAFDSCDLPILTPSRVSISAMRRGIVSWADR